MQHAAEELFGAYDMDGDGTLDPLEILYLYKAMLPTMTPIQVKLILIYMQVCACIRGTLICRNAKNKRNIALRWHVIYISSSDEFSMY